jgi:hypothetical protein
MADVQPIDSNQQPISDDQELAKVLAGVSQQADDGAVASDAAAATPPADQPAAEPAPVEAEAPATTVPALDPVMPAAVAADSELDGVKQEALNELRPLVDKLNVAPEEKFDTYLLLLRSTDDKDLIAPAHEAAKGIADEARRAQALLDIIKEIDFLSQK